MTMDIKDGTNIPLREGISSSETLSLFSICLEPEASAELREFVKATPFLRLQAEAHNYLTDSDASFNLIEPPGPDICLIDFDKNRESAIATAEGIHERFPNAAIFAISSLSQPNLIIQAMRCGCSEYVVKPADRDQLLEAVARVGGRKKEKREQTSGQVLTFIGAKGGSGVTTLVTHLGALLARSFSRSTLLVDLHPTCGEAALFLGLTKHQYHFYDLVENIDRLDAELLQSYVLNHPSGLGLLPAPDFTEPERHVEMEAIGQAMEFIRYRYDFVLVDCPPGLNEQNVEIIRRSDAVHIVTVPEVPPLRNVARFLDYFMRIEYPLEKVHIIVNRHNKKSAISDDEIEKAIRKKIYWKVPNQYHEVIKTINAGDPSVQVSSSEVARTLQSWAATIGARPSDKVPVAKKAGKGFLSILGR
jgi:pilus assembly protein CpaE